MWETIWEWVGGILILAGLVFVGFACLLTIETNKEVNALRAELDTVEDRIKNQGVTIALTRNMVGEILSNQRKIIDNQFKMLTQ